jgi:hypothetical protein
MGKNLKYGEFDFGQPKTAMKDGGMCKGYAKGGPKMAQKAMKREPEAMVRKEVALLKKAGAPKAIIEHEVREASSPIAMKKGGKVGCYAEGGQFASEARPKMAAEGRAVNKLAKKFGTETQKYAKGGGVEAKLEKHANMPASKAHGPGAGNKLAKGGVPTFSKTPKFGKTK